MTWGRPDPAYFLGGRIRLNRAKAEAVIKTRIADRLGVSIVEAAHLIREEMGTRIRKEILRFVESHGIGAAGLSEFAVVVYGGAGPTHYSDFAKGLDFGRSVATPYASVFSAFNLDWVIIPILMTILGGAGTILGPILGAFILSGIFELANMLMPQLHPIFSAAFIVLVTLFLPDGLMKYITGHKEGVLRRLPLFRAIVRGT